MSLFSSSAIFILTIFSNSQFKSMSSKQFAVPLMTTAVHFRRNFYIMALSPVTQVGEKSQKASFVVVPFYNDSYSIRLYIDLAIHCYTKQLKKDHISDSTVSVHGNIYEDNRY